MEGVTTFAIFQSCLDYLIDIGRFALNERDREKLATIQIDLSHKIIQAQSQILEMQSAVTNERAVTNALKERIAELESKQREKARYQLAKMGVVGEFFAYKLRPASELTERADEPNHFLCQPCFDADKKSVLFVSEYTAVCNICHTVGSLRERAVAQGNRGFY